MGPGGQQAGRPSRQSPADDLSHHGGGQQRSGEAAVHNATRPAALLNCSEPVAETRQVLERRAEDFRSRKVVNLLVGRVQRPAHVSQDPVRRRADLLGSEAGGGPELFGADRLLSDQHAAEGLGMNRGS